MVLGGILRSERLCHVLETYGVLWARWWTMVEPHLIKQAL